MSAGWDRSYITPEYLDEAKRVWSAQAKAVREERESNRLLRQEEEARAAEAKRAADAEAAEARLALMWCRENGNPHRR